MRTVALAIRPARVWGDFPRRIDKLAASFLKHRSGVGLRAPRRATPRLKTADLLFQPVGS
jgi:hypothetical protein